MRRPRLKTVLAILCLAAAGAGVLTVRDLRRGMTASRTLYQVDVRASQLAGELESSAEECRRTYLYALATADPNEQLPFIDRSRAADAALQSNLDQLRQLPEEAAPVEDLAAFADAWHRYGAARDTTIALILTGNPGGALALESGEAEKHFNRAVAALRHIKNALNNHAHAQSFALNQLMIHGTAKPGLFIAALAGMIWALVRATCEKENLLHDLRKSNANLCNAHRQERSRADVLKMINQQSALPDTLRALAALAQAVNDNAGVSIWVAVDGMFRLEAKAGTAAAGHESDRPMNSAEELEDDPAARTATLRDSSGSEVGILRVQPPDGERFSDAAFAEMTQLAAMAIENRRLYDQLAFQAQHDLLTGLPNRVLFRDRLDQALQLARRGGSKAAVIWIDLDRYKQINDTLGHAAGDELLQRVAERLRESVRACDTVARMGGDEFAVVLGGIRESIEAEKVAAKIQLALALPVTLVGHETRVSACCGISVYPDHGRDEATLVGNADLAMYSAKRSGRNASVMFKAEFGDSLKRRQHIEQDLPDAVANDGLRLEYQPLVDRGGNVRALEALLRWDHPGLGEVSPSELIPIAEESGAIIKLGEWVLRRACAEGSAFLSSGCVMAVNVSRKQLARPDFSSVVAHILRVTGFPPNQLELEVTETTLMRHLDAVIGQVERLRALGVRFAMDDFGAGYSSLNLLGRLPVDSIKIDRSFIELLDDESGFGTLVGGLISLAHSMQLNVVAEGVETHKQLRILQEMECDLSQGFLLHRPMHPEEALATLRLQTAAIPQTMAG